MVRSYYQLASKSWLQYIFTLRSGCLVLFAYKKKSFSNFQQYPLLTLYTATQSLEPRSNEAIRYDIFAFFSRNVLLWKTQSGLFLFSPKSTLPWSLHWLCLNWRTLTIGGSITARFNSCLIGLDLSKQVNMLFILQKQGSWIQTKKTKG